MKGAEERIRHMRLLVFFDLPVVTASQKRAYRLFRKYLVSEGYLMLQKSVYAKMVVNDTSAASAICRLRASRPPEGVVQVLKVTEKQYSSMEFIAGSRAVCEQLDTMEELVVI